MQVGRSKNTYIFNSLERYAGDARHLSAEFLERLGPAIIVLDADDVVLAEVTAGLHLD
jgi:hypothetical protein